ncbi:photosystem reaction center subunit H [Haloferax mediterranei ATCC 33500]|uniref:Photosystem reaction center subunit H n=1 Tax=Haloferax mediterranei (strain ATCC 33500 / DSM 1411 / JCM 8866 / NBRC 14739 / NCIMB 2177 / R-4) TaxID=523841 RepID=I3R6F1_HALMT|nr:PRC-barrel domain-containing protein [Haloferax mediterranei]AFK19811.1 hypothetical protein HFX_2120 [Haloferax mediterranei ATCC 33500]AHZ23195.1 photosystem reaction center subunit H [Haloferax mediterranei ATCC 33500]ELZ99773.1 hypothetical protein C439_12394 [Haloferax mediterranei ATCC 33500]MDX5987442.1 PRC-barrel domain-containing protein [Haloferax mediterranei ATCC 33500]QCQ73944.1 photosystem reaction center subunit H [Haloferax mediterranei ATCC 33500]
MALHSTTSVEPIPSVDGLPVYAASGNRIGEAIDLCVDLENDCVTGLLVSMDEPLANVEAGERGVRIPYRFVDGIADIIVLTSDPIIESVE